MTRLVAVVRVAADARAEGAVAQTTIDARAMHLELATKYEAMAQADARQITDHERMLADYRKRLYVNDKITPPRMFEKREKHCGDLILAAKGLKAEYDAQARFHRFRASEPDGRQPMVTTRPGLYARSVRAATRLSNLGVAAILSVGGGTIVHAEDVSHVPGAPHPTANSAVIPSACPIYFVEFGQRLESGRLVLSGRISNAGPGTARLVTVEAHAVGKDGSEVATYSNVATPAAIAGGASARFEVVLPIRDWERERSDTAFDQSRVEEHVARCDPSDQDPTDSQGNTRSSYQRRAFSAAEELTLLQHRIRVASGEVHSAIIRNERAAYGELPEMRRRVGELNDLLTRELPQAAHSAGAPAEWVEVAR